MNIIFEHNIGYLPVAQDTYAPDNSVLKGNIMYCIDTGVWWHMAFEDDVIPKGLITVAQRRVQYIWVTKAFDPTGLEEGYGLHPNFYNAGSSMTEDAGFDIFRSGDAATLYAYRIPIGIYTNLVDFNSSNRKFINRATLVGDTIYNSVPSVTGVNPFANETFEIYLCYTHNDMAKTDASEWKIRETTYTFPTTEVYTNQQRLYWNNLGHAREYKFAIICNSWTPIRWEALDLMVSLGTH
jgi:hypothetical protein